VELGQHRRHGLARAAAASQLPVDQMRDHFAVGLTLEPRPLRSQLIAQLLEILDDPVVDQAHLAGRVRVRIVLGRRAVRRPARVGDARRAVERRVAQLGRQFRSLPGARRRSIAPSTMVAMPAES
jgi:hypothetical protein